MISVLAVACVAGLCPRWVHEGTAASAALRHVPPARWSRATPGADPEKPAASSGRRGPVVSTGDPWPPPVEPEQQAARRSAEDVWDARWPESTGTVLNTTRRNPGGQCRWPGSHEQPWSGWGRSPRALVQELAKRWGWRSSARLSPAEDSPEAVRGALLSAPLSPSDGRAAPLPDSTAGRLPEEPPCCVRRSRSDLGQRKSGPKSMSSSGMASPEPMPSAGKSISSYPKLGYSSAFASSVGSTVTSW